MARKFLTLEQHTKLKLEEIQKGFYLPDPEPTKLQPGVVVCTCHLPTRDTSETKIENDILYRKTLCFGCGKMQWRIA